LYTIDENRLSQQTLGIAINNTEEKLVSFGSDTTIYLYDVKTRARIMHFTHACVRL